MPECDCGTEITDTNTAGHYRDQCAECIAAAAGEGRDDRRDPATWLAEEETPEGYDE
jgi:hypothetical protein